MSKIFAGVLLVIMIVGLLFGGYILFSKYIFVGGQVEKMIFKMSGLQTAEVKVSINTASVGINSKFLFDDINIEGAVDLRIPEQPSYDLKISVESELSSRTERAVFLARQIRGQTFINLVDAPASLFSSLEEVGIVKGEWIQVSDSKQVLSLIASGVELLSASDATLSSVREFAAQNEWFLKPQATLTEIIHGKVARIFTAEVNADAIVEFGKLSFKLNNGIDPSGDDLAKIISSGESCKNSRANLWIDQSNSELRRMIVQLSNGSQFDVEFKNIDGDVNIVLPSEEISLPDSNDALSTVADSVSESEPTSQIKNESAPEFPTVDDSDGDGLTDDLETFYGTDALKADTDGDGYSDYVEVSNGYNPNGDGALFNFGLPTL
jgi:hypothetical protein